MICHFRCGLRFGLCQQTACKPLTGVFGSGTQTTSPKTRYRISDTDIKHQSHELKSQTPGIIKYQTPGIMDTDS